MKGKADEGWDVDCSRLMLVGRLPRVKVRVKAMVFSVKRWATTRESILLANGNQHLKSHE